MFCENSKLRTEALEFFPLAEHNNIKNKIIPLCMGVPYTAAESAINQNHNYSYDFGFIGRLTKKKGVHFFIDALRLLNQQGSAAKTVIAGDGEEGAHLQEAAQALDIEFTGFVSDQEKLNARYQSVDPANPIHLLP